MAHKKEATIVEEMEIDGLGLVTAGKKVKHPIFGNGVIMELYQWESGDRTIRVEFEKHGSKALVPEYAKLKSRMW